jgi:hypothetical protein
VVRFGYGFGYCVVGKLSHFEEVFGKRLWLLYFKYSVKLKEVLEEVGLCYEGVRINDYGYS